MTKIIIILPCWKRTEILKVVSKQFEVFINANKLKAEISVLFIFSEDDPQIKKQLSVFNSAKYPKDMIYASNEFLGNKINDGIKYALKLDFDYIMNMGSDNLIHESLIDLYANHIYKQTPLFGLNSLYFHNAGGKSIFFKNYNRPHIVGAARMIHKRAIIEVTRKFGALYEKEIQRCLDGKSAKRLLLCGFRQHTVDSGDFPMLVDIKCETNINSFDSVYNLSYRKDVEIVDSDVLKKYYPSILKLKKYAF